MDSYANDLYYLFCAYIKEPLVFARGNSEKAVLGKFINHVNSNREDFKDLFDEGIKLLSFKKLEKIEPGGVVPMKVSVNIINPGDTITLTRKGVFIMELKLDKKFIIL